MLSQIMGVFHLTHSSARSGSQMTNSSVSATFSLMKYKEGAGMHGKVSPLVIAASYVFALEQNPISDAISPLNDCAIVASSVVGSSYVTGFLVSPLLRVAQENASQGTTYHYEPKSLLK
jgi:hypothetical protein